VIHQSGDRKGVVLDAPGVLDLLLVEGETQLPFAQSLLLVQAAQSSPVSVPLLDLIRLQAPLVRLSPGQTQQRQQHSQGHLHVQMRFFE